MIRGYAPHIWENKLESDKRRDTALLLAAELDDRKVAIVRRLRCASPCEISVRPFPGRFSFHFFKKGLEGRGEPFLKRFSAIPFLF